MYPRLRFSLANALLATASIAFAVGWWATAHRKENSPTSARRFRPAGGDFFELPITISASEVGRFAKGKSWYLSVNSVGQATVTIDGDLNHAKQFTVTPEQLAGIRQAAQFLDFFLLDGDYGEFSMNGDLRTMTVSIGKYSNTVRIHSFKNIDLSDRTKLLRLMPVINSWNKIRELVTFPEAADSRSEDQLLSNAVRNNVSEEQQGSQSR
jgi:hypothetical protein